MKLYERLGDTGFHSSVTSTFGIDFDAYESIALSRLRAGGCRNNVVLADERMLARCLDDGSSLPRLAGRQYSVRGVGSPGVFHPKVCLQLGRRRGRVIISSANLTAPGLAGNLELAGIVECTEQPGLDQKIVVSVWRYLSDLCRNSNSNLGHQLARMEAGTPWLTDALDRSATMSDAESAEVAFLVPRPGSGLFEQFIGRFAGEQVKTLTVLSPYWDADGKALLGLAARLFPRRVNVLIDPSTALFPVEAVKDLPGLRVIDTRSLAKGRFIHAKLFVAQTERADHVLFGSANCTRAALGDVGFRGLNEEACLYRRLTPGEAVRVLGLGDLLADGFALPLDQVPPMSLPIDLGPPIGGQRVPGHFEYRVDRLVWRQPAGLPAEGARVLLYANDMTPLAISLEPLGPTDSSPVVYRVTGDQSAPSFAKVEFSDGTRSGLAVIESVMDLMKVSRESVASRTERALRQLDEETEVDLTLLEALDDLEAADREYDARSKQHRKRHPVANAEDDDAAKVVDYQTFISGRHLRPDYHAPGHVSIAGTEQSFVRQFLNRVLAISGSHSESLPTEAADEPSALFDLGDEVANADAAIEEGVSFEAPVVRAPGPPIPRNEQEELNRRTASRRVANRHQLVAAVNALDQRVRQSLAQQTLTTADMLRQRALLTILAASGLSDAMTRRSTDSGRSPQAMSTLQVLPMSGADDGWPRLIGRTVHTFFSGTVPPVRLVTLPSYGDHVPDDVLEFWATNFWAAQACRAATAYRPISPKFGAVLERLTRSVYRECGLRAEEILDGRVHEVLGRMSERFAARLGLDPAKLEELHRASGAIR